MKRVLREAPIVHVVVDLILSPCLALKLADERVEESVLSKMIDLGLPDYIKADGQEVIFHIDPGQGTAERKNGDELRRRIFMNAAKTTLLELRFDRIIYKSTDYSDFEAFLLLFLRSIKAILESAPQCSKSFVKRVGFRCVDVIAPKTGSTLEGYVCEHLTAYKPNLESAEKIAGFSKVSLSTGESRQMNILFEEVLAKDNRVRKVLPDNLLEPDARCALNIGGREWWANIKSKMYGLLDIDHIEVFEEGAAFDADALESVIKGLHSESSEVFWSMIQGQAKSDFGYEEVNDGEVSS